MLRKAIVPAVLLLAALSCRTDTASQVPIDQPEDPESPRNPMPMGEHFVQAEQIRDAVIAGDLRGVRTPANWLLENVIAEDVPVRWKVHVPAVRRAAKTIAEDEDMNAVAVAAGRLAESCGDCHQDIGITVHPPERADPLKDDTAFAQMGRHAYAAELMWDGLVGPLDEAWNEGSTMMAEAPLYGDAAPESVTALADEMHALANEAVEKTGNARAKAYGKIIGTCAGCHTALGK